VDVLSLNEALAGLVERGGTQTAGH
jgi:hypothetical protein